jgi:molecular chaperone DnaK (HSP70)
MIRFVSEPEGAILCLQHRGLLSTGGESVATLIVDVGGSTTDIVAGQVDTHTGALHYIGRYGEPFGGGLYDAELAKVIIDDLNIPPSTFTDDPSALVTLRIFGQRLKESLSRQLSQKNQANPSSQRTLTLVIRDGTVYRRVIELDEAKFRKIMKNLDQGFTNLIDNAMKTISLKESDIGQVVLVGGGAQLFTLTEYLRQRFGREKVLLADNAEEIVVQGIGLEYGASFGKHGPTIQFAVETPEPEPVSLTSAPKNDANLSLTCEDGQIFPFSKVVLTAGRGETNDIRLDDLKVSRFHTEFRLRDEKVEVVDLGSTNGTYINGKKLTPHQPCVLKLKDEVIIGKAKIRIKQ